jgi:hypothetical protein
MGRTRRRIPLPTRKGIDILHWGKKGDKNFSVKDAYRVSMGTLENVKMPVWIKFWDSNQWLKIATFLWLVVNKKELTWDRLTKLGFKGPQIFLMFYQEGKTMNHLLSSCSVDFSLWYQGAMLLLTLDRTKNNINKTIEY